jgi:hypothetical protein
MTNILDLQALTATETLETPGFLSNNCPSSKSVIIIVTTFRR